MKIFRFLFPYFFKKKKEESNEEKPKEEKTKIILKIKSSEQKHREKLLKDYEEGKVLKFEEIDKSRKGGK